MNGPADITSFSICPNLTTLSHWYNGKRPFAVICLPKDGSRLLVNYKPYVHPSFQFVVHVLKASHLCHMVIKTNLSTQVGTSLETADG